jgi:DNA-binding transcriptional MocR family regulator
MVAATGATVTEQSGQYIQTPTDPDVLNLGLGQPSPSLLPIGAFGEAAAGALGPGVDRLLMQYGAVRGYTGFLVSLAGFLSRGYGLKVTEDELLVTGGISQGLGLVADVFGRGHRRVATGDPTYFLARGILETAGLELIGVPVDEHGLDVDALAEQLEAGLRIGLLYCIPAFHNPCAVTLDPRRAQRLVELAERHDFIVVADEPYVLLNFGPRPPCMMSYDQGRGRVVSLGSFSKILGPGLRLGWAHAAAPLVERLSYHGVLRSGGGLNPIVSAITHCLLDDGFLDRHIEVLRATLSKRAAALEAALRESLPAASFSSAAGGYFMWLDFGPGVNTTALDERGRAEHGVGLTPGARCAVGRDLSHCARVSFAFYDEDELTEAARRLAKAL